MNSTMHQALAVRQDFGGTSSTLTAQETASAYVAAQAKADIDHFSIDLMEGGSARYGFRVKCNPTGEQIKRLYEVLGGEVDISVTPAAEKQGSLGLDGNDN